MGFRIPGFIIPVFSAPGGIPGLPGFSVPRIFIPVCGQRQRAGQPISKLAHKKILARMAAILAILSVSRECIGILNIFYKKVFRSAPLRRGDTSILRSREPVKSQIRSVYSTEAVQIQYSRYSTGTVQIPTGSGISQGRATLKSMYLGV